MKGRASGVLMEEMPKLTPLLLLALVLTLAPLGAADEAAGKAQDAAKAEAARIARLKQEMALRAEVPKAVARGLVWLRKQQQPDGSFSRIPMAGVNAPVMSYHHVGRTALAALTMSHLGAAPDDAHLAKALTWLRKNYRGAMKKGTQGATYSMSLLAMALHTVHKRQGERADDAAERTNPLGLPAKDLAMVRVVGRWLLQTRVKDGLFGYPSPALKIPVKMRRLLPRGAPHKAAARSDMSNTQYALLGLWACARCGVEIPVKDLASIADALLASQAKSGPAVKRTFDPAPGDDRSGHRYSVTDRARGFAYSRPTGPNIATYMTGSMTSGGLSSLLIAKAILREQEELSERLERRLDRGIWDAIAWLSKHFAVDRNPGVMDLASLPVEQAKLLGQGVAPQTMTGMWHYYYLYGLERAFVIAGKRYAGKHDWYLEGARWLLDRQAGDGRWPKPPKKVKKGAAVPFARATWPVVETCFALLFLERATLRPRSPLIDVRPREPKED